jgi:PAS domain S-box-containing protein
MKKMALLSPVVPDSAALLTAIINSSQDAILHTDSTGIINCWNPAAVRMFGYTEHEIVGKNSSLLIPDGLFDVQMISADAPGRQYHSIRKRKDGSLFDASITVTHVPGAETGIPGYLMMIKDISDTRHTVTDFAITDSHLKAIFDHAEEGFVLLDNNCIIKAFNSKASESIVLSFSKTEVKAGNSIFEYIEESRINFFTEMITSVLKGKSLRYDRSYEQPDGTTNWFNFSLNPVREGDVITGICITGNNITKRKLAEQLAEQNEKRFRGLVENSGDAVSILSPGGIPNYVSPSILKILGYSEQEAMGMGLFSIVHPDDLPAVKKVWEKILLTPGIPFTGNICRIRHSCGSWRWIDGTITNMLHDPAINGIVDNFRDITEAIEADQQLRKAYGEKKNILESFTDGFLTLDKNWIVTYWNKEAERMMMMPRENILGKMIWDIYPSSIPLKFYTENYRAMTEQVPVNFEEFFAPLDLWIDVTAYPSDEGLVIYFKDITEKKYTQENIRLTKERYEMVAKATNDAIYEWDVVSSSCYWGEGYETLFGHTRSSDKMAATSWVDNLHPDEKEALLARTYKAFENKETSMTRELQFRCADGGYKTVFDKLVILYDANEQPLKIVGAMQDITERKKNETAIAELNKQLNKRATELVQSNDELERFAYVASHDLQEPLRMVGSFVQLLQKKYGHQLDETANQYIDFAVDGADRMKKLILDLLEYSRVGTNKDVMTNVDLSEIVLTIMKDFSSKANGVEPIFRLALLPEIRANKMQVSQLLQNLVSNALKYNTSPIPEVEIGYKEKADSWQFFVKDNGIGIEQKFLHKVFIIFQRLHNKNQFSGTGIGLAICKKIVERHGGAIWIESEQGKGSTFYFTIKK